jgi:stress-induced morphogen
MTDQELKARLSAKFLGAKIEVNDLTGTNDHYEVVIRSGALAALKRIDSHKSVMSVFDPELKTGEIHALTIRILPEEN